MGTPRIALVVALLVIPLAANAQEMSNAMKQVFAGKQFKHYQWLDYPVDDYGIGTAYKGTSGDIQGGSFLCATFSCFGIVRPDPTKPAGLAQWLTLAGTADPDGFANSGCGGGIDTALSRHPSWAINVLVPRLLEVLGLSANASDDRSANITLTLASACNRKLQQVKAIQYLTRIDHPDTYGVRAAYNGNDLVMVLEDVVVTSFDIKVTTNAQLKTGLDAKLAQDPTGKFGQGSDLQFTLQRSSDTEYHLKSTEPLIVGYLAESNHNANMGLGIGPGVLHQWAGWTPVNVSRPARRATR